MYRTFKWIVFLCFFILSGCATKPIAESNFSDKGILLDQVNIKAKGDTSWFNSANQVKQTYTQKYSGVKNPGTAIYLENDTYIYEDEKISAYLLRIVDKLLQGWEGEKPNISVVIISDESFNAFVDELNQLHITTGLLRKIENEDQLASIFAHEISHILLKHNPEKGMINSVSNNIGVGGLLASSIGSYMGGEYKSMGAATSFGLSALGLLWSDMLAPHWSRKNELEADKMGMDLLIRANYNYEELPVVLEKIFDSAGKRSEQFNKISNKVDSIRKNEINKKVDNEYVEQLSSLAFASLSNTLNDEVASKNKSHEDRVTRINALKTYLNTEHSGGELPPEVIDKELKNTINDPISKPKLDQDLIAIETISALQSDDIELAKTKATDISLDSDLNLITSYIAKSSLEILNNDYENATNNLLRLTNHNNSPAEAYIKLANLYISKNNYDEAEKTLLLGAQKIGRDYKFLPVMIALYKASGNKPAAEKATVKCREYDSFRENVLNPLLSSDSSNTYYKSCATILGYDVDKPILLPTAGKFLKIVPLLLRAP